MSMTINFPFPNDYPYGETIITEFKIPIQSVNGIRYAGIASLILLILSLYYLWKSLRKYNSRFIVLAILLAIFSPKFLVESFQKIFATGIYAIKYEPNKSKCSFDMINEKTLHGVCELPFENYSRNDVQFNVEFYDKYQLEDDIQIVSLMNKNTPSEVKLRGKESKTVKFEADIDVSKMEKHIDGGGATEVNIIISSLDKSRKL